jgi:hypothetical protein
MNFEILYMLELASNNTNNVTTGILMLALCITFSRGHKDSYRRDSGGSYAFVHL